jgi:hypothetical protein
VKGLWITYSDAELAWIEANAQRPRAEAHADFVDRFDRQDVSFENYKALGIRRGWKTGRTGCFPKGNAPFNKGRKGYCAPGSERGWFRKGERRGVATRLYKPIGTERIVKGGYLQRKVNDDLPLQRRWRFVHVLNWEAANGPVPDGHALKCLDGDKLNTAAENWAPVPRAMLPRLAGVKKGINYDDASSELRPALMAAAKLQHATREARKNER